MAGESNWAKAWKIVGHISNLQTVWGLGVAFLTTSRVISGLPGGWHPPQYWAIAGAWFCLTWAIVASLMHLASLAIAYLKRRRYPPSIVLEPSGGATGAITIRHSGSRSRIRVEGRILKKLDDSENPRAEPFEARMAAVGSAQSLREIELEGNTWALIRVAAIGVNQYTGRDWLEIRHGSSDIVVGDGGIELELIVTADGKATAWLFEVGRSADNPRHVYVVNAAG